MSDPFLDACDFLNCAQEAVWEGDYESALEALRVSRSAYAEAAEGHLASEDVKAFHNTYEALRRILAEVNAAPETLH